MKENIRNIFRASCFRKKYKNFFRKNISGLMPRSVLGSSTIDYWRFWFCKKKVLLNLINHHFYIDKISLCSKDLYEVKHQLLISKSQGVGLKYSNDSKAFIEYSKNMDGI